MSGRSDIPTPEKIDFELLEHNFNKFKENFSKKFLINKAPVSELEFRIFNYFCTQIIYILKNAYSRKNWRYVHESVSGRFG